MAHFRIATIPCGCRGNPVSQARQPQGIVATRELLEGLLVHRAGSCYLCRRSISLHSKFQGKVSTAQRDDGQNACPGETPAYLPDGGGCWQYFCTGSDPLL